MSGDCPRIVASRTSCDYVRPGSPKWSEKDFGGYLKQLSREELEIEFYNLHTKNECLSKAMKDNMKQMKRLNKAIKKNEEERKRCLSPNKQLYEDRISQLEQANNFLQDKVLVLRHQLQSHSRLHAKAHRNSSHHTRSIHSTKTSQTHLSQLPTENINQDEKNDSDEALNVDLVENENRILQLQNELDQNPNDASKVAENIELIRLRRLVKRQAAQLSTLNAHLEVSDKELEQLRTSYNQASQENDEVLKQLMSEKLRLREMQNELLELGNLKQDIKILQEHVRDLQSERTLLRSNNDKLLEIASGKAEEDNKSQQKLDTDKEIIEKYSKEEAEKIYSKTKKAKEICFSHDLLNSFLEDYKYLVSKRVAGTFTEHKLFKELLAKTFVANTYDLDIESCTEVSLFKAFSHQTLSDILAKQFFCPSTLNFTVMPLTQIPDNSIRDEENDENVPDESEGASQDVIGNYNDTTESELSLNDAKFVFMQLLKHELENYDSLSNLADQVNNGEGVNSNAEVNYANENNVVENPNNNRSLSFRQSTSLIDYFWGIVGYKLFFPKKFKKLGNKIVISEYLEEASGDDAKNQPSGSNNDRLHFDTISFSDQSFNSNSTIEGCILKISMVGDNDHGPDRIAINQEPNFDIGEIERSISIRNSSHQSLKSDLQQRIEDFFQNQTKYKSKAEGDAASSDLSGLNSSHEKSKTSVQDSEKFEGLQNEKLDNSTVEDDYSATNFSSSHQEHKNSSAQKSMIEDNDHVSDSTVINEEPNFDISENEQRKSIENSLHQSINSDLQQRIGDFFQNQTKFKSKAEGDLASSDLSGLSSSHQKSRTSSVQDDKKSGEVLQNEKLANSNVEDDYFATNSSKISSHQVQKTFTAQKSSEDSDVNNSARESCYLANKCSCSASPGAGQYVLEEHNPDPSNMNGIDSKEDDIQSLPNQNKNTFIVYNLNSVTGSKDKIGVLYLKKLSCKCNLKSIIGSQTQDDNQLPPASNNEEINKYSENPTGYSDQNLQFSNGDPKNIADGGFCQKPLESAENEIESRKRKVVNAENESNSKSFGSGLSLSDNESTPLLTLLRNVLEKIMGDSVIDLSGPRSSADGVLFESSKNKDDGNTVESSKCADTALLRKSKMKNINDKNDIFESPRYSLEPVSASNTSDRNRENFTHKRSSSIKRLSEPELSKLDAKTIQARTYNRKSTDKNEKLGNNSAGSGLTLKKMTDRPTSSRRNSNSSSNRSPDTKTTETLNNKNIGKPSEAEKTSNSTANSSRQNSNSWSSRSPDNKTSQTLSNKNLGKPSEAEKTSNSTGRQNNNSWSTKSSDNKTTQTLNNKNFRKLSEVEKTSPQYRDIWLKNMVREGHEKGSQLPQTRDSQSTNHSRQNSKTPVVSSNYSRCKTPRNSGEGFKCVSDVQRIFQSPVNQLNRCVESSDGSNEVYERNSSQFCYVHDRAEPISEYRSAFSNHNCPLESEIIAHIKKLLELLNQNASRNSNESHSAEEFSNDEDDGRMAFCEDEDDDNDGTIDTPQNSCKKMCAVYHDCGCSHLNSDESHPKECPSSLNKKFRLQQLNVSNDSPFSSNEKSDARNSKINQVECVHKVNKSSDPDNQQNRPHHPEMIIVIGKKLKIYESDKIDKK